MPWRAWSDSGFTFRADRGRKYAAGMILAAVGDTGYNIMLLLHILSAMVAFAPAFTHPILKGQSRDLDASARSKVLGFIAQNGRRVYGPALILTGLFGFGVQGMSESAWGFDQGWLLTAAIIWVLMNGVLHGMIFPAEKALAAGDDSAEKKLDAGGATITVMLIVMLWLMTFKPGL